MSEFLDKSVCPFCHTKNLTLNQEEIDIPYFGKVFVFSMTCSGCKFHKADVETVESGDPTSYSFEISSEEDMKVRVVRSAESTLKIPRMITITPGPASQGYVTNIEGVLNRVKRAIEQGRDAEEDPATKKKAKNLLKRLQKAIWGQEKLTVILEDPSGNSAIISERAVKKKL